MKSQRQRQMEALERLEERVELWEKIKKARMPLGNNSLSWADMAFIDNYENGIKGLVILAERKIKTLTRDINNLKKKLEF